MPIRVVSVPRSEADLEALFARFLEARTGRTPGVNLAGLETRVDLGQLVLSISIEGDRAAAEAMALRLASELRAADVPEDGFVLTGIAHRPWGRVLSARRHDHAFGPGRCIG